MYAVIATGGKQYKVTPGEMVKIERLIADTGTVTEFPVLMVANDTGQLKVGGPYLRDVTVRATIVEHGRGNKVKIIKFRRRKHHRKQMGHRQHYTIIKIAEDL